MRILSRLLVAFAVISALSASTLAVHAEQITDVISFTASGQAGASGTYTLTFDPSLTYLADTTSGLTVDSLTYPKGFTPPAASATGFTYGGGILVIGGLLNGVSGVSSSTNDYYVVLGLSQTPTFYFFAASLGENLAVDDAGTVTVTSLNPSAVPEPASLALLGTGILGLSGMVRRRLVRA